MKTIRMIWIVLFGIFGNFGTGFNWGKFCWPCFTSVFTYTYPG